MVSKDGSPKLEKKNVWSHIPPEIPIKKSTVIDS